jgi:hypothetical protein
MCQRTCPLLFPPTNPLQDRPVRRLTSPQALRVWFHRATRPGHPLASRAASRAHRQPVRIPHSLLVSPARSPQVRPAVSPPRSPLLPPLSNQALHPVSNHLLSPALHQARNPVLVQLHSPVDTPRDRQQRNPTASPLFSPPLSPRRSQAVNRQASLPLSRLASPPRSLRCSLLHSRQTSLMASQPAFPLIVYSLCQLQTAPLSPPEIVGHHELPPTHPLGEGARQHRRATPRSRAPPGDQSSPCRLQRQVPGGLVITLLRQCSAQSSLLL